MDIAALNFNFHVCQNSMDKTMPKYVSTCLETFLTVVPFFFSILLFESCLYNIISSDSQLSNDRMRGEIIIPIL